MPKKKKSAAVSFDPDDMTSGLPDDFDAEITDVTFVPFDYDGRSDEYGFTLSARVTYSTDNPAFGEDGVVVDHLSAGRLDFFMPSADGEEPVDFDEDEWDGHDEEYEGKYLVPVGSGKKLSGRTNWARWLKEARAAGFEDFQPSASCFEGVYGHFNQLPQDARPGIVTTDEEDDRPAKTILVLTEIKDKPKGKGGAKAGKGAKSRKKAAVEDDDDGDDGDDGDDAAITAAVKAAVDKAGEDGVAKAKLPGIVMKAFKTPKEKKAAMSRVTDAEFLEASDAWAFDEDSPDVLYSMDLFE